MKVRHNLYASVLILLVIGSIAIYKSFIRSTAAPTPMGILAETSATLIYQEAGGWYERVGDNAIRQISRHQEGATPASGTIIASIIVDDTLVVLHSLGRIEQISLTDGTALSAVGFSEPALYAHLISGPNPTQVVYAATISDTNAQFSLGTRIGIYDLAANTTRLFPPFDRNVFVIGVSTDKRSLYLLPKGQDPAYQTVQVFDMESERIARELDTSGYGSPYLAPNGQLLTTIDVAGMSALYDLAATSPTALRIPPPDQSGHVCQCAWAANSRSIYLVICAGIRSATEGIRPSSLGLWRVDLERNTLNLISTGITGQQPFITSNGNQLLFQHSGTQNASLIDTATGVVQSITLPVGTTPMESIDYSPVTSLSPNGEWFLWWNSRDKTANLVKLADDTPLSFPFEIDPNQPILWRSFHRN